MGANREVVERARRRHAAACADVLRRNAQLLTEARRCWEAEVVRPTQIFNRSISWLLQRAHAARSEIKLVKAFLKELLKHKPPPPGELKPVQMDALKLALTSAFKRRAAGS